MNIENKFLFVCLQLIVLLAPLTVGGMQEGSSWAGAFTRHLTFSNLPSLSVERVCRLYSVGAKGNLFIHKHKVTAPPSTTNTSDQRGEIGLESVMKDNVLLTRIRGRLTGHYLCFNHKGRIVSKPKGRAHGPKCQFIEQVEPAGTRFRSALQPAWYLGFNKKGSGIVGGTYKEGRCPECFLFEKTAIFDTDAHNKVIGQVPPGLPRNFLIDFRRKGPAAAAGPAPPPHRRRHSKNKNRRKPVSSSTTQRSS